LNLYKFRQKLTIATADGENIALLTKVYVKTAEYIFIYPLEFFPEIVILSRWMLFLNSSRVRGFVL
jgi:hypothetical protein